jgi:hypothetical protein
MRAMSASVALSLALAVAPLADDSSDGSEHQEIALSTLKIGRYEDT